MTYTPNSSSSFGFRSSQWGVVATHFQRWPESADHWLGQNTYKHER